MRLNPYTCANCGASFERKPWRESKRCYCSTACRNAGFRVDVAQRFWAKVQRGGPDECWPWLGRCASGGYGQFDLPEPGGQIGAHRMAFTLATSIEPGALDVLHRCDNPPCCNPNHFFLGTDMDNKRDAMAKGRHARGESSGFAKLTDAMVIEARVAVAAGGQIRALARRYGVHEATLGRAVRGINWSHVDPAGCGNRPHIWLAEA